MHIGTLLYTWLKGELVGTDSFGNRYYRASGARLHGRERRWVLYRGRGEASKVPPEWHAWLHHMAERPLSELAAQPRPWQKPHLPNLTGTLGATFPAGYDGARQPASADYRPWTPE